MIFWKPALALVLCATLCDARQDPVSCGTHGDKSQEEFHLHRVSQRSGKLRTHAASLIGEREIGGKSVQPDVGNIAVLDDADGVVARRNSFSLARKTLRFLPSSPGKYRFEVAENSYDTDAATNGNPLTGISDDDFQSVSLPFSFPFFGRNYSAVFINSDGNLTFDAGDNGSGSRTIGRISAGPPRIAALFTDLDPSAGGTIRVLSQPTRLVISWVQVPEYSDFGTGAQQTVQMRLYPDGRIEYAYSNITILESVVGIARGRLEAKTTVVSFATGNSEEYESTVAERFSSGEEIDIFTAAQKFYLSHEDAYDFIVLYNNMGISADLGAVAFEVTVRNSREGYGDTKVDLGKEAGSPKRLQAILNMGPLDQYPLDPNGIVTGRGTARDTVMTVLGHEMGHLFLAYASVRDPNNPTAAPMLGRQRAHWNFAFNSEASLLEGNRIRDDGPNTNPRFTTVATVEGFAPLDQYLMGFRPATEVPPTFLVQNTNINTSSRGPQVGVRFNGTRRDVSVEELIQTVGRRTPDSTVAQRKFRMAIVLITASGTTPSAAEIEQIENYRATFEGFFQRVASDNATVDTQLKKAVQISTFPAAGVLEGGSAMATVSVQSAPTSPLTVLLRSASDAVGLPASITIPAGSKEASFTFTGVRQGSDDLTAEPADTTYETSVSRVQVAARNTVKVVVRSGDKQTIRPGSALADPIAFRITDLNELPYPGVRVRVSATSGSVDVNEGVTDSDGIVRFRWTPGQGQTNELRATADTGASATAIAIGQPNFAAGAVVNAASFAAGISPGGIATIFGANLQGANGTTVEINGATTTVFYSAPGQVNFYVPSDTPTGTADVAIITSAGKSSVIKVPVNTFAPGIFYNTATGYGSILINGTANTTEQIPVDRGKYIEIYATGLGPLSTGSNGLQETTTLPQVLLNGVALAVPFSGAAPRFPGLYQINAEIPADAPTGAQSLVLSTGGLTSNSVKLNIR